MKLPTLILTLLMGSPTLASTTFPVHQINPVDEASEDVKLVEFRKKLIGIAQKRDTQALRSVIDGKSIRATFGHDSGDLEGFLGHWKLKGKNSIKSPLWNELLATLKLGGAFIKSGSTRYFVAPYIAAKWPESEIFQYEFLVTTNEDVSVYSKPSDKSSVLRKISYEIVKRNDNESDHKHAAKWTHIALADGKTGYIAKKLLRSPMDYRIWIGKVGDEWKINSFIAGD